MFNIPLNMLNFISMIIYPDNHLQTFANWIYFSSMPCFDVSLTFLSFLVLNCFVVHHLLDINLIWLQISAIYIFLCKKDKTYLHHSFQVTSLELSLTSIYHKKDFKWRKCTLDSIKISNEHFFDFRRNTCKNVYLAKTYNTLNIFHLCGVWKINCANMMLTFCLPA